MNRNTIRQIVSAVVILGAFAVANVAGFMASSGSQRDIANTNFADSSYFFPADYVFFTLWSLIYTGVAIFAVYQALPSQRDNARFAKSSYILALNMVLNASWVLIFAQEQFVLSFVVILPILVTTGLVYWWLEVGRAAQATLFERIAIWIPISVYFAWVSVATVANVTITLISLEWGGFGISGETWGVIMLVVAGLLGLIVHRLLLDVVYLLVFIYAYVGIVVRWWQDSTIVSYTSIGVIVLLVLAVIYNFVSNVRHQSTSPQNA